MAAIFDATLLTGRAERLAGATACPKRSVGWISGELHGERPSADSGEEVAVPELSQIVGGDVGDTPGVDDARPEKLSADEVSEPLRCVFIVLVEVVHHSQCSQSVSMVPIR